MLTLLNPTITNYDNKWVLNNNLEGVSVVVKLVDSKGYIVKTVVRTSSAALNLKLLQLDISLEPINGDAGCNTVKNLEEFYKNILADANENPHRQGKAAYNLAILIYRRFDIVNELYFKDWFGLIKTAITLGHPQAKLLYINAYCEVFPADLRQNEEALLLFNLVEKESLISETKIEIKKGYEGLRWHLDKKTKKNPLLADSLTTLVQLIASNQKSIPFDLLFKLFLMRRPAIILFLLVNFEVNQKKICILKEKRKFRISKLFELERLKELFESLPSYVQSHVIHNTTLIANRMIVPILKEEGVNTDFCLEALITSPVKYGAETLRLVSVQKYYWRLEIMQGQKVAENFILWMRSSIDQINEEQGSALSLFSEQLLEIVPYLYNCPGVVIYEASCLLEALSEEAKGELYLEAFKKVIRNAIFVAFKQLISKEEMEYLERNRSHIADVFYLVDQLLSQQTFWISVEKFTGLPTLQAFLSFMRAQILHSLGNIEEAKDMLVQAEKYCLIKATLKRIQKNKSVVLYDNPKQDALNLLELISNLLKECNA